LLSEALLGLDALHLRRPLGQAVGPVLDCTNDSILDLLGVVGELILGLETGLLEKFLDLLFVAHLHLLELVALVFKEADDAIDVDVDVLEAVTEHLAKTGAGISDVASAFDLGGPPPLVTATVVADVLAFVNVTIHKTFVQGVVIVS